MTPLQKLEAQILEALRTGDRKAAEDGARALMGDLAPGALVWFIHNPAAKCVFTAVVAGLRVAFRLNGTAWALCFPDNGCTVEGDGALSEALSQVRAKLTEQARLRTEAAERIGALLAAPEAFEAALHRTVWGADTDMPQSSPARLDVYWGGLLTNDQRDDLRARFPVRPRWAE